MTFSPLLVPVSLLLPLCMFAFLGISALESPSIRALPFIVLVTIVLLQLRLIAYYFYIIRSQGLLRL